MSDVSAVTHLLATANEGFTTTLASTISSGATTVPLTSVTGLTNGTTFVGIIEPGGTKQQVFTGIVDTGSSSVTGVKWTRGSNVSHSGGVTIVDYITGTAFNMLRKAIATEHNDNGTHAAINATGLNLNGNFAQSSGTFTLQDGILSTRSLINPYKFSVYKSATSAITASTWTKVAFNTKNFDTSNNFDATTNYRFTAPISGYYQFNAQVSIGSAGTGTFAICALYINGAATYFSEQSQGSGNATVIQRPSVSVLVHLNASDTVELYGYCGESRDFTGGSGITYMQGYLVSTS